MYAVLMGKLNARRKGLLAEDEKGFTLIELLVVVIIIGILAAIAIPIYIGVQDNAKDSAVQSDVVNAKTAAVSLQTNTGTAPAAIADLKTEITTAGSVWAKAGATVSDNTASLSYTTDGNSAVCIAGVSSTGTKYAADASTGAKKGATCSAAGVLVP